MSLHVQTSGSRVMYGPGAAVHLPTKPLIPPLVIADQFGHHAAMEMVGYREDYPLVQHQCLARGMLARFKRKDPAQLVHLVCWVSMQWGPE